MSGYSTPQHSPDEIHLWHPKVEETNRKKLSNQAQALWLKVEDNAKAAKRDKEALAYDRKLLLIPEQNYRGEPHWEGLFWVTNLEASSYNTLPYPPFKYRNADSLCRVCTNVA